MSVRLPPQCATGWKHEVESKFDGLRNRFRIRLRLGVCLGSRSLLQTTINSFPFSSKRLMYSSRNCFSSQSPSCRVYRASHPVQFQILTPCILCVYVQTQAPSELPRRKSPMRTSREEEYSMDGETGDSDAMWNETKTMQNTMELTLTQKKREQEQVEKDKTSWCC